MKRSLLVAVFSVWMVCGFANDTLTRREIYNFEVGDTFVYWHHANDGNPFPPIYYNYYTAKVVTAKYVSPGNDVFSYDWIHPYTMNSWSTSYTDLDSFEIFMHCPIDTTFGRVPYLFGIVNGTNITTNTVVTCGSGTYTYAHGLGEISWSFGYYNLANAEYHTDLIYFSKDTVKWGYYPLNLAIDELNPQSAIRISPNPATTTTITLQLQQRPGASTAFQLFDITGRMVLQKPLTETTNRIELNGVSKGMYLYNVVTEGEKAGAGKLIIE